MRYKHNEYVITYLSKGEKIDELYSTFEVVCLLVFSAFLKDVHILSLKRNSFYSDDELE